MSDQEQKSIEFPSILDGVDKRYLLVFPGTHYFHDKTPSGITIHYTANNNISATINELMSKQLGYHFIIGKDGTVYQCSEMCNSLDHAGAAMWGGESPNRTHLSIAVESWGLLKKEYFSEGSALGTPSREQYITWAKTEVPKEECIYAQAEWWQKMTGVQEAALVHLVVKLIDLGIDPEKICGHDECCIPRKRKIDPGGVVDVDRLRNYLR